MIFFLHKYNETDDLTFSIHQQNLIFIHEQKNMKHEVKNVQNDTFHFSTYEFLDFVKKEFGNEIEIATPLTHLNKPIAKTHINLQKEIDDERLH